MIPNIYPLFLHDHTYICTNTYRKLQVLTKLLNSETHLIYFETKALLNLVLLIYFIVLQHFIFVYLELFEPRN